MNKYSPWWNGFVFGMLSEMAIIILLSWLGYNFNFSDKTVSQIQNITTELTGRVER